MIKPTTNNSLFRFLLLTSFLSYGSTLNNNQYQAARNIRTIQGHDAALPYYQTLLSTNNIEDTTAGVRIAAGEKSPNRHERTAVYEKKSDVTCLRELLRKSDYTAKGIGRLFGVATTDASGSTTAPLYVKSIIPDGNNIESPDVAGSALKCLVSLFLLGYAIPKATLESELKNGVQAVHLLQKLGLLFPCELQKELLVPFAMIFPVEVCNATSLFFVTDWHPNVLGLTNIGRNDHGAVMYIGPDSLALLQHFTTSILPHHLQRSSSSSKSYQVLDLCCGSGIQSIASLAILLHHEYDAYAVCVDINPRALRFTIFNALLNGLQDRVSTSLQDLQPYNIKHFQYRFGAKFNLILANPPFIPVPPKADNIQRRYGLFSSAGSTGEEVLETLLAVSPHLLHESNGILAIVSEFMNPDYMPQKLTHWWNSTRSAFGILYSNEFPISSSLYAQRRSNNDKEEYPIWSRHLDQSGITKISPGLLFIYSNSTTSDNTSLCVLHKIIPKSDKGSIWTPANMDAIDFTRDAWLKEFGTE